MSTILLTHNLICNNASIKFRSLKIKIKTNLRNTSLLIRNKYEIFILEFLIFNHHQTINVC